ncbi:iron-containing alcohol dehydrogenase [Ruminiclostridium herbifermentans]|uniref:Iron-containing alcohol dehydrogenase n=1 Tax=Ruminiclostridium herbifermentans TaxID=2488810 RepID=A0A4U7JND2_9FIRM|nr:iron-containing alcohol dehydrogenase [Ruminiclostridium herbifermentans]QNU68533.1 iron-containing alcohol dehydrogenase [Ruminiclostridium herbifermentans]
MDNFTFYSPTKFVFGSNTESQCGSLVKEFGGTKVLIVYGGGSVVRSGLLDKIKQSLSASSINYSELGGIVPNPKDDKVYEGIDICRNEKVDFVLAVGGGSAIDTAKAIAAGVPYDGDFWDFFSGKASVQKALPVATVLTIAAAGSEGSGNTVITKVDGMLKRGAGSDCLRPVFSILNPQLTVTLPAYQTACGAADIMAHVFERYFTNTRDVEITDRLCEAVLLTMINEVPKVIKHPDNYQARANIMWAGMVAHNNTVGVGRSHDWNSHGIEHELSALYDCAHGAGLAVIMPAWMTYVKNHDIMRFAQAAVRIWGCEMDFQNPENTAIEGITRFKNFLSSIGLPVTFKELGAKEEDIPLLVKNFGIGNGKTGGFVPLGKDDIEAIYRLAL